MEKQTCRNLGLHLCQTLALAVIGGMSHLDESRTPAPLHEIGKQHTARQGGLPPESGNSILDTTWKNIKGKIHWTNFHEGLGGLAVFKVDGP